MISGTLRGDALGVENPPWGVALRDGVVRAELDANRLRITEARIAAGDGTLSASGTLPLALPFRPESPVTLEWQAAQFRVFGRPDRRLVVSGKGTTSFDGKRLGLAGELRADSGHFEIARTRCRSSTTTSRWRARMPLRRASARRCRWTSTCSSTWATA
jgi:translocation and assembly module TamB